MFVYSQQKRISRASVEKNVQLNKLIDMQWIPHTPSLACNGVKMWGSIHERAL